MKKIIEKLNQNYFDIACICILTTCCFISLFWQWFSLSILAVAIYYFITKQTERSLGVVAFLIPFHYVLRVSNITLVTYFVYVSFFIISFFRLLKNKELKFDKIIGVILLMILIYSLLPFGTYKMVRWRWISTFFILIGAYYILKHFVNKIEFSKIVYCLFFGLIISSLFRGYLDSPEFAAKFDLNSDAGRFEGLMINPNYLSEVCAMACSMLLVVLYKNKNVIFTSLCFVGCMGVGLLTRSKAFVLLSIILVSVFLFYFLLLARKKQNKVLQILLCFGFVFGLFAAALIVNTRINLSDFENLTITNILSNRNTIWEMALNDLTKNPITLLFGLGVGSEIRWEQAQTCHSVYIEVLQKFGIIGTLLFVALAIYCLVNLFKNYKFKNNLINLLPIIILAIYSLTDTIIFPATSMMVFPLCLICLFYCLDKKQES